MVKLPEDEDTPEKRVKKIVRVMDTDEKGCPDMEELRGGSRGASMTDWCRRSGDSTGSGMQNMNKTSTGKRNKHE